MKEIRKFCLIFGIGYILINFFTIPKIFWACVILHIVASICVVIGVILWLKEIRIKRGG